MNILTTFLSGLCLGYLTWLIPRYIEKNEKKHTIGNSLILEILYMHRSPLFLRLDDYVRTQNTALNMPTLPTTIYDANLGAIDRVFGSSIALQIHYYYSLIKRLEIIRKTSTDEIEKKLEIDYRDLAVEAYSMLRGTINAISGNSDAQKEIENNLLSLVKSYSETAAYNQDKDLLEKYRNKRK